MSAVFHLCVIGAGPAGSAMALAAARLGLHVALVDKAPPRRPGPTATITTALLPGQVALLQRLRLWEALAPLAAPLRVMALRDEAGARAVDTRFDAAEIGADHLALNLPNDALQAALDTALAALPHVTRFAPAEPESLVTGRGLAILRLADGRLIEAGLVVGADGRQSATRRLAGIGATSWQGGRRALAFGLAHDLPHHDVSTEFHGSEDMVTLVPMKGRNSAIIWTLADEAATELATRPPAELAGRLADRTGHLLGRGRVTSKVAQARVSAVLAHGLTAPGLVLMAEAAHAMPAIGAQGLNTSLADVAVLAELLESRAVAGAHTPPAALGRPGLTGAYARARLPDMLARFAAVTALYGLVAGDTPPVRLARSLAFPGLNRLPPLRRALIRAGLSPLGALPGWMTQDSATRTASA